MELDEKQVVEAVQKEIETIGIRSKENYDELQKNYKKLKDEFDNNNSKLDEKTAKLQEDILTRQDAIDKSNAEINKRLDDMEVASKRPVKTINDNGVEFKEAKDFMLACKITQKKPPTVDELKIMNIDLDAYNAYKNAYEIFLRREERLITPDQQKALSIGIDPDGGYTVTPAMNNAIKDKIYEMDPIRQLSSAQSISTESLELLESWDEADAGWETETVTTDRDTPRLNKVVIPVNFLRAAQKVTQALLEDSSINIESWLASKVADKMARVEGEAFVTGDGIGKPRGFLTYDNGTSFNQIQQVAMGAAAALTADGFISVKYALYEYYLNRGTWLMQRSTVAAAMKLKDGEGNYLWKPSIAVDAPSTMLSLPVRMSPTMPTVAANALSVVLADWTEAYQIVDRLGITMMRDQYTAYPFIKFRARKRVGAGIKNFDAIKIGKIST